MATLDCGVDTCFTLHLQIHLPYETSPGQDKVMHTETFVAWIKSHCLVHRSRGHERLGPLALSLTYFPSLPGPLSNGRPEQLISLLYLSAYPAMRA